MNSSADETGNTTPKVLIVDDEPGVLRAIHRLLLDEHCQVLTAQGGHEALALLNETGPVQLLISDYRMPVMNGVEFLQQTMHRWPDTRRMILSAFPDTEVLLSAVNEGRIHRFMVKPWDNDALRDTVREMLQEFAILEQFRRDAEELTRTNRLLSRTNEHLSSILADVLAGIRQELPVGVRGQRPVMAAVDGLEQLSPRERRVLCGLAAGQPVKAIALELGVSIKTVSTYKKRLCDKMKFNNDAELIVYAVRHNLYPA